MEQNHKEVVKHLEEMSKRLGSSAENYRTSVFQRFPILFIGLSTFGVVATLYGFEKNIDSIPALADRPYHILATGLVVLLITGTLYKKLQ